MNIETKIPKLNLIQRLLIHGHRPRYFVIIFSFIGCDLYNIYKDNIKLRFMSRVFNKSLRYLEKIKQDDILKLVVDNRYILIGVPSLWLNNKKFVIKLLNQNCNAFKFISSNLQNDNAVRNASPILQRDKAIVLVAIGQDPCALDYASSDLKNDKEIVLAAVVEHKYSLNYASVNLQQDKDVIALYNIS